MSATLLKKISIIASLVIIIGGTLTFIMTWRNVSFSEDFISLWLSSFLLCVVCIAPIGGLIAFLLNKLIVKALPTTATDIQINVLFGISMAIVMETIMSAVTTINTLGINNTFTTNELLNYWLLAFVAALPAGITFSVIISLIIKPKLQQIWAK